MGADRSRPVTGIVSNAKLVTKMHHHWTVPGAAGVEITSIAGIPSLGTGLGSSSSFTVGLLHARQEPHGRRVILYQP